MGIVGELCHLDPWLLAPDLHPAIEVRAFDAPDGSILVNLMNNSGQIQTAVRRPVPMRDLVLKVRADTRPTGITALVSGQTLDIENDCGMTVLRLPELKLYEQILISTR